MKTPIFMLQIAVRLGMELTIPILHIPIESQRNN